MDLKNIIEKIKEMKMSGKFTISDIVVAMENKELKLLRDISEYISGNVEYYDELGDLKKKFKDVLDLINESVKILNS